MNRYRIYGITLATDFPFSWPIPRVDETAPHPPAGDARHVRFRFVESPPEELDWAAIPTVHQVAYEDEPGNPFLTYHVLDGVDVFRVRGVADHYIYPDRILCQLHDEGLTQLVEIQLLGTVLALWLERRGTSILHASTVVMEGRGVAFMGWKGSGKTTLAVDLVCGGWPLLVDDLLALSVGSDGVLAHPGYPMLRLTPEQIRTFIGKGASFPRVHPEFEKRRVPVGEGFGAFQPEAVPLSRIYLVQRRSAPSERPGGSASASVPASPVRIDPLSRRDALLALLQHAYLRDAGPGMGFMEERLSGLGRVAEYVSVATLQYPSGFGHMAAVRQAIQEDLQDTR